MNLYFGTEKENKVIIVYFSNTNMQIFKTSFIQVFLVSINTICLSKGLYFGVALFGFLISWFWVTNVKKANIATKKDQFIYALGAMIGGLSGLILTKIIL